MGFKDFMAKDIGVFINPDEFGDVFLINGKEMAVVVDSNVLSSRDNTEGTYRGEIVFNVPKDDFGAQPAIGQIIDFNGKRRRVADCQENEGIYTITLEANRS